MYVYAYVYIDTYVCVSISFHVSSLSHACNSKNDAFRASM